MINFVFEENDPMQREETSPAPYFRFDHGTIRQGPDEGVVAHLLTSGMWETRDKFHVRGNCIGKTQICFENDAGNTSRCFGPYQCVRITGGAIYGEDKVIALFMENSHRWMSLADHTEWPVVLVSAL